MGWKRIMSRQAANGQIVGKGNVRKGNVRKGEQDHDRKKTEDALRKYAREIQENLNLRLLCEEEQNLSFREAAILPRRILWVEDVVFTGVTYPEKKRTGNRFKGIRELFRRIKKILLNLF